MELTFSGWQQTQQINKRYEGGDDVKKQMRPRGEVTGGGHRCAVPLRAARGEGPRGQPSGEGLSGESPAPAGAALPLRKRSKGWGRGNQDQAKRGAI